MTHKDIYTKFMIEYDKAGASTSYPSLTEYEIATFLDKAYNALIAQKVTGNNYRRSTFESDSKAIADLGPLTKSDYAQLIRTAEEEKIAPNVSKCSTPSDMLYFLNAFMQYSKQAGTKGYTSYEGGYNPADSNTTRNIGVKLVNHEIAQNFMSSATNIPWVKEPVCFIEGNNIYVVYDPLNPPTINDTDPNKSFRITYIKRPMTFVKDLSDTTGITGNISYFDYPATNADQIKWPSNTAEGLPSSTKLEDRYKFECNSTMAEELISLAVAFALENVESQRLNAKLNMRGLEA